MSGGVKVACAVAGLLTICLMGPTSAAATPLVATIDLSKQQMTVSFNGEEQFAWPISSARDGYVTPTGSYSPYRMHRMWYSRKYDMSPMPYSIFFHGGYAIHGTDHIRNLGRRASHGCVRLHPSNAARLYQLVNRIGMANLSIVINR